MSRLTQRRRAQRRDLLKGMAVAGGGVALAATTGATLADTGAQAELTGPESRTRGYEETAHVREYYDKARF